MIQEPVTYSILSLPEEDRPRERLARLGPESMSTVDLISIVLGSGMKGRPVQQLAHEIMSNFGSLKGLSEATIAELQQIKGLGLAKAIQLKAALSLGMRLSRHSICPKYRIENPIHAYNLVKDEFASEKREHFIIILLDVKGFVINHHVIAIGTLTQTLIHPREVFYPAIRHKAAGIILVHNHPSGDPSPSKEDLEITGLLVKAGELVSIPVHDHLIIAESGYISLRQKRSLLLSVDLVDKVDLGGKYLSTHVIWMVMISYKNVIHKLENAVTFTATAWIPQRPWVAIVSGGAWWYGRRVALTYAPGYIANYFINMTVGFVGSEATGRFLGTILIAPMFTPSVTPWVATATGGILFYIVALICNLAIKVFGNSQSSISRHDLIGPDT